MKTQSSAMLVKKRQFFPKSLIKEVRNLCHNVWSAKISAKGPSSTSKNPFARHVLKVGINISDKADRGKKQFNGYLTSPVKMD